MYTGNTPLCLIKNFRLSVYPCVYREHTAQGQNLLFFRGLSLCIQGTHRTILHRNTNHRFIPVYTGNTDFPHFLDCSTAVYPCVYREHQSVKRGTSQTARFIPVYTGNTNIGWKYFLVLTVYPCVYREHLVRALISFFHLGLSLCIQGTHGVRS